MNDMDITTQVMDDFREYYSEFASSATYPDALVKKCLNRGAQASGGSLWGEYEYADYKASTRAMGLFSYAAHYLVREKSYFDAVLAGQMPPPGMAVTSKSVGDESESYGRAALSVTQEGLASTSYGQEYLELQGRLGFAGRMI